MVNHTYDDQDRDVGAAAPHAERQFTGRDDPSASTSLAGLKMAAQQGLKGAPSATRVTNRPAADNDSTQMIMALQAQLEVAEQNISDAQQEYEYASIKLASLQNIRQALRAAYDTIVPSTQQGGAIPPIASKRF